MARFRLLLILLLAPLAAAQTTHSVTITITDTSNTGATYSVYRASGACPVTPPTVSLGTLLNTTPIPGQIYVDTNVTGGQAYCYNVVAITSAGSSAPSNDAGAVVPGAFPVSITVVAR